MISQSSLQRKKYLVAYNFLFLNCNTHNQFNTYILMIDGTSIILLLKLKLTYQQWE